MATLTATAVDQSKLQKVTNNSGADIVVGMPLTSAEKENSNAIISYNKDFVILPASGGGTVIKAGASDTVTLDRSHTDSKTGKPTYSLGYDLLISSAGWLSPIANIGVIQDFDDDKEPEIDFFNPQTVNADAKTAMQQTADFYQTIASYPDSKLAKDYVNAMNNVNPGSGSADEVNNSIAKGVAAFFQSTKAYQKVTLPNIVALEAYYNRFPFAWAAYANAVTYFLYSSDGKTTTFQGVLSMTKSGDVDITRANGGYTCSFVPAVAPSDTSKTDVDNSKAKALTFSDGVFTDDLNADEPAIALKGTFQLKRTFTKDPNDTKIMVVISGSINGQIAIGFDQAQATKADDTTQDWLNSLFHPKTASEIFSSVMTILGALMMLHFIGTTLFGIGKWIKEKAAGKQPVTDDDIKAEKESLQSEFKARQRASLRKIARDKASLSDSAEEGLTKAATEKGTVSDCVSAGQTETNLLKMKDNLKVMEEYVPNDSTGTMQGRINDAAGDIRSSYNEISSSEIADLKAALADLRPQLTDLSAKLTQLTSDMQKMVSEQQKADIEENVKEMQTVEEAIENESKTAENEGSDGDNADPESDPVEIPDL